MSYTHGKRSIDFRSVAGLQLILTQTPAVKAVIYPGLQPLEVVAISFVVTTAMTVTAAVISVKYRPVAGAASNEVTIGTITIPTSGAAAGKVIYKRVTPYKCAPGGDITYELVTASTAGAGALSIEVNDATENPADNSNMVASA